MSTQRGSGISFSLLPEDQQQHFRLVELPPELLELVTSSAAPTLQFKQQAISQKNDPGTVLCTPDKTYHVRQVNTSNSVLICQPKGAVQTDDNEHQPHGTLQAIAQSTFTLELTSAKGVSAVPYLRAELPSFSSRDMFAEQPCRSIVEIFADVPLSERECRQAWSDLACFSLSDPVRHFIPTAVVKTDAWRAMLQQADAAGIRLTQSMSQEEIDLVQNVEDWPTALLRSLWNRIADDSLEEGSRLDETKPLRTVGLDQLAALTETKGAVNVREFLDCWMDLLPEQWRSRADVAVLPTTHYQLNGETIIYIDADSLAQTAEAASQSKSTLGSKRKWHDKFRNSSKRTA